MKKDLKIAIIGLGLIGGSIFKSLSKNFEVFGVSRSEKTIEEAKKYSNKVSQSLDSIKDCDLVFVCTPMNKTLDILDELNNILSANTIVTDVCSLKEFVCKKEYNFEFIPSHPMAGTENNGFEASFEKLFNGAKWVLTPKKDTKQESIKLLLDVIEKLGANPIFATPKEHDEAVAIISHMPMLLAQAIFKNAENNELALNIASSGFRDMTRLAMSNTEMAEDMINMNSENIQKAVLSLYSQVGELLNGDYKSQITNIKSKREKMF